MITAEKIVMSRAALKTLTYGAMHFTVAVTVAYAVTGSWTTALGVGIIEPLVQTGFYNLHEKLWARAGETAPVRAHAHAC